MKAHVDHAEEKSPLYFDVNSVRKLIHGFVKDVTLQFNAYIYIVWIYLIQNPLPIRLNYSNNSFNKFANKI